jgi:aromatic ring-opening dioxygenase catalytic subunit (LigB family)
MPQASGDPLPTLYIPHGGGPCFFMDWNPPHAWDKLAAWLGKLGESLPRPKAIVVISGHWEADAISATGAQRPPLLYDYYGFPEHTYRIQYPAPGAPELAQEIAELLASRGIASQIDPARGFDHGVFIPFKVIYPDAGVPIVQLSLKTGLDSAAHIELGRALAPLRRQGVLIVGSGMSFHNLREFGRDPNPESDLFDAWLSEAACTADPETRAAKLAQWKNAPGARRAHPREEHLLPLMVAAGAAGDDAGSKIFHDRIMGASISAFGFGMPTGLITL